MPLIVQLPTPEDQSTYNVNRWNQLQEDQLLAHLPYKIETDRHGRILMSPPPALDHTYRISKITRALFQRLPHGLTLGETAVSTKDGVKVTDAAWLSLAREPEVKAGPCLIQAPEICVEVLLPSNAELEMDERRSLYFDAGAKEVWICDLDGSIRFYTGCEGQPAAKSGLCPDFPATV
jgi:Uma2 family endonuclease